MAAQIKIFPLVDSSQVPLFEVELPVLKVIGCFALKQPNTFQ